MGNLRSKGKQECSRQEMRERPGRRGLLADPGTTWDWALETVKNRPVTGSFGVSSSKDSRNFSRDRLGWATGQGLQEYNLPSDYEALKKLNKVYLDSSRPICPQPHAWRCPIQTTLFTSSALTANAWNSFKRGEKTCSIHIQRKNDKNATVWLR